ncbi:uncharacterized protein Z519_12783 [Cladophialophora bantiana CBS 173.52]|uniref:Xylanolytic transcriptional activator regulatory domain-containing protein n=1 Tax=Cladophialophora bantiana (strain ATCC 10958 / CBS 173.52 / CDC B-1940 / NIH 8579) TaxID=1442370 RepID=A0A0D2HQ80_CLAB1|nr:uncharacterized protein Z519_12783 [Cladophialophora bantiana CBS 173.52]KIW86599.1 hypothetical protein Z519_12783 [Cladophialophora bantiana CBS 173.52]
MPRFQPFRANRVPDPDRATAFRYVQAYFDHSYDAVFGVLHGPKFKARLEAQFDNQGASQVEDPSWFALRNVVYALGCRCMLAPDDNVSFVEAEAQAKPYFHNALSAFGEIIFGHSGFTAIQALVLMTFYAEGLGNAAIEFPLCSNAVQLAQARGLHRAPSKSWALSESDSLSRSWLWWTIYCLEKQIAFRSGRPSLIDDNNISTPIPTKAPPGSSMDVGIFTLIIQNARISAQVSSRIMSVKAFGQSSTQIIETIHDIHSQLEKLLESIPPELRIGTSVSTHDCMSAQRQIPMMYLHCAIFGSFMATHSILFYPWISARFGTDADPSFQEQITASSEIVANAARQIILMLRKLTTDAAVPAWLAFYFPIYAHINLFVHTLMYPTAPNAVGDLALMDICAGHFGHVEHITGSEIAFHFPRESAALCAKAVKGVKSTDRVNLTTVPATPQASGATLDCSRPNESGRGEALEPLEPCELGNPFDALEFDMDSWNFFSSIDITDNFTPNLMEIASAL